MSVAPYVPEYKDFDKTKDTVFYSGPYWNEDEIEAGMKSFMDGKWITSGLEVAKFQNKFSKKFGIKYSHMVNSGSSANLVMMAALKRYFGWKDGSEVIVSPVGFPTTIAPIVQNGLKPVFIDIELSTLNFDVNSIEEKITKETVAIIVSPVLGNPPDMYFLFSLCEKKNIKLILDNCDSLGSTWNGAPLTEFTIASSCSFYPAHHISTGEGGMISSNKQEIIELARSISWWGRGCYCVGANNQLPNGTCGKRFDTWLENYEGMVDHKYYFTEMGYNLKPLDLQGAIGQVQLNKFEEIHAKRVANFEWIKSYVEALDGVRVANNHKEAEPSWFGVPIICSTREQKEGLVKHFEDNRIQTRNYFAGNILLHPGYSFLDDYRKYPNANKALSHVFFLGCAPHYTQAVLEYIEEVCQSWKS